MDIRGIWLGAAALAALAGCGREAPAPAPEREANAPGAKPPELVAPIAPPVDAATASPEPTEPVPSAEPAAKPGPVVAYPPRDECAKLPGFAEFRDKLFAAAKAKDVEALAALADPKINLDFGGGAGTDELRKRLSDPKVRLWDEIAALSGLGCAVDGGIATMPAIFSRVPEDVDAATTMLVTGTDVPMRAKPERTAETVRTLDWALVSLAKGFDPGATYTEVTAADGSRGHVLTAKLRSLLDYRLIAERQGEDWKITALIAGD